MSNRGGGSYEEMMAANRRQKPVAELVAVIALLTGPGLLVMGNVMGAGRRRNGTGSGRVGEVSGRGR